MEYTVKYKINAEEMYEIIFDAISGMPSEEIISLHNAYCDKTNRPDDYIYLMDEFDDILNGVDPWEIARMCFYGSREGFCPARNFFRFNGYGNLVSFDYYDDPDNGIYVDDIADYITNEDDDLGNVEIAGILAEFEAAEEDEEEGETEC